MLRKGSVFWILSEMIAIKEVFKLNLLDILSESEIGL